MSLDSELSSIKRTVNEDAVREIHLLAARLRAEFGELDDAAIQAVSETTGMPEDYVRLAVRSAPAEEKRTHLDKLKGSFLAFDPDLRRYTMSGVLAAACGLSIALNASTRDTSGFLGTLAMLGCVGALWNSAVAKSTKVAALSGAIFGAFTFVVMTFFTFLFSLLPNFGAHGPPPGFILFWIIGSIFASVFANQLFVANRQRLGFRDPTKERHELLTQLQDIQEKLKSDERFVTFLSVDIVGSTRLKAESDPFSVEFTFTEYHKYVQSVVEKYGGKVHSTAGDGATCVFESPQMGYAAGRALLAGLFEFNSFRNRLQKPLEIRSGVHTGSAHVAGESLTNVNFAHVIDVAAHMQKAGDPGSLVVSETTAHYLPGGLEGLGTEQVEVQDFKAAIWRPKIKMPASALPKPESV